VFNQRGAIEYGFGFGDAGFGIDFRNQDGIGQGANGLRHN
jgi:hypothetical protein